MGILGSMLVVWDYDIDIVPTTVALHFLALGVGYLISSLVAEWLLQRTSIRLACLAAGAIGLVSLVALTYLGPPVWLWWRLVGLASAGAGGGLLMTSLLHGVQPFYRQFPAAAVNLASMMFGLGCLAVTAILASTYDTGHPRIQAALLGSIPAIYLVLFLLNRVRPGASLYRPARV